MSLVLATCWLTACTPDDGPVVGPEPMPEASMKVELHLGIAAQDGIATQDGIASQVHSRADYSDTYMVAGELMRNWLVVITDKENQIIDIVRNEAYGSGETERSADDFWERMTPGVYTFYSFANIQASELGLDDKKKGDYLPYGFFENQKYSVKIPSPVFTDHWSDYPLDYFPNGIPMSNKQVVEVTENTKSINLEVVRMVAKMMLTLTNTTSHDISLTGFTLSDVTPCTIEDNLLLLPAADETDEKGEVHVGSPNLAITELQKQVASYVPQESSSSHNFVIQKNGGTKNICFYVNESEATAENKYFVLQLHTTDDTNTEVNRRYAMLDWRQICRNDYRVIPISLGDYAIEWKVEGFTPIGVLPEVEDDGENLTITFGTYGEFHIIPAVKQLSTGQTVDSWDISNRKCEEIVSTPSGAYGIFDVAPSWTPSGSKIEGEMGNRSGTSIYKISMDVRQPDGIKLTLARKVRFVMKAIQF